MGDLTALLRFALVVVGFVYLITESGIGFPLLRAPVLGATKALTDRADRVPTLATFAPWLRALVYCPSCVAFWVGLVAGDLCGLYPIDALPGEAGVVAMALMTIVAKTVGWGGNWEHERDAVEGAIDDTRPSKPRLVKIGRDEEDDDDEAPPAA